MEIRKWPTLYKKTSTGAQQEWTISVRGNVITTVYGQTGGKMQTARDTIHEGKNLGRSNATTPEQQAIAEAQSKWEMKKKGKHGYVESAEGAMAGEVDDSIEGGIFPMLAKVFEEQEKKLVYPAFAQPKLDGHRCIVTVKDGKATLWSRTRKPIKSMPHIVRAFEELLEGDAIFDGELYNHDYRDRFEELTSLIRSEEPKEGHEVVQYHVYDLPWVDDDFEFRHDALKHFFANVPRASPLIMVETREILDKKELDAALEHFLEQEYEGAIARNAKGLYVGKRTHYLLKYKKFIDKEFKIVGVNEGRGKLAGKAIFVCVTDKKDPVAGLHFNAKMEGKLSDLEQYWRNPALAIGRQITVKFQNYYKKSGMPRFPVAHRFREDI